LTLIVSFFKTYNRSKEPKKHEFESEEEYKNKRIEYIVTIVSKPFLILLGGFILKQFL